jgi:hypothetical protein
MNQRLASCKWIPESDAPTEGWPCSYQCFGRLPVIFGLRPRRIPCPEESFMAFLLPKNVQAYPTPIIDQMDDAHEYKQHSRPVMQLPPVASLIPSQSADDHRNCNQQKQDQQYGIDEFESFVLHD